MPRFRFSIRTLLLIFTVVAIYFPVRNAYEPWQRKRLKKSSVNYFVNENLSAISQGDSVATVTRRFPSLIEVDSNPTLLGNLRLPKFQNADKLYRYVYPGPGTIGFGFLHFRDGRLASHPKAYFSDPSAITRSQGATVPTILERMRALPMYLLVLSAVSAIYLLFRQLVQMFRRRSPRTVSENSNPSECTNVG